MGQAFRSPKTTQEIRANQIQYDNEIIEEAGCRIHIRPKRVNLPTEWDDLQFSTKYNDNSWKRHRKNQYRHARPNLKLVSVSEEESYDIPDVYSDNLGWDD